MKKTFIVAIMFFCCSKVVFPQTNSLQGIISNAENMPVSFATITLRTIKDSTVANYTSSDESGKYQISKIKNGNTALKLAV
ncbi:MAG: hypothetical protein LBP63_09925 [Prevotellaceae bacterium]|jgi:hypothetical protein|nr:hypothetical protein [Prevotellaceae bacterium]